MPNVEVGFENKLIYSVPRVNGHLYPNGLPVPEFIIKRTDEQKKRGVKIGQVINPGAVDETGRLLHSYELVEPPTLLEDVERLEREDHYLDIYGVKFMIQAALAFT